MHSTIGRRSFIGKAAPAALALPLAVHAVAGKEQPAGREPGNASQAADASKFKKIAVEEHWTAYDVIDAAGRTRAGNAERQADLGTIRLGEMDAAGITMQVIANSSYQFLTDVQKAIELARKNNDRLAEMIRKHPDRFAGFAALPTQDPKTAVDELERAVKQLGFKGAMIEGQDHANYEYLDSKKFWPLWERAEALEVPIYLHPNTPPDESFKMIEGHPELRALMWAGGVYTATQALRLAGAGVFDEFPRLTLMLGHLGELLPYWMGRLDESARSWKTKKPPSAYIRENFLVTTSGHYRPEALVCAVSAMGADRVLFATDYAAVSGKVAVELVEQAPLSAAEKEKIYHLNAERWLRL